MVSIVVEPRGVGTDPAVGASTVVETGGGQELLLLLGPTITKC